VNFPPLICTFLAAIIFGPWLAISFTICEPSLLDFVAIVLDIVGCVFLGGHFVMLKPVLRRKGSLSNGSGTTRGHGVRKSGLRATCGDRSVYLRFFIIIDFLRNPDAIISVLFRNDHCKCI